MKQATKPVALYDGKCPFCREQVNRLTRLSGQYFNKESFHEPGVLQKYAPLTHEECMKEMKLVLPDGKILGGAEAVFHTLSLHPLWRPVRWLYAIPGFRQIFNGVYRIIARNRYRIKKDDCSEGRCALPS